MEDEGHSHAPLMCSRPLPHPDHQPLLLCHKCSHYPCSPFLVPAVKVNAYILGGEGGVVMANVSLPFKRHFLQLKSNTTDKSQKWKHNEALLETLIGWTFFLLLPLFFFTVASPTLYWGVSFHSDAH